MNLIETFLFALAIALTIVVAYYFFEYIGWWGILPALILGFGFVILPINFLDRVTRRKNDEGTDQKSKQ